jgi:hypothetical protein
LTFSWIEGTFNKYNANVRLLEQMDTGKKSLTGVALQRSDDGFVAKLLLEEKGSNSNEWKAHCQMRTQSALQNAY